MNQPVRIAGYERIAKTPDGLDIIQMVEFQGQMIVATSRHVYRLAQRRKGHYELVPIRLRVKP